jgi:hypothetical protein
MPGESCDLLGYQMNYNSYDLKKMDKKKDAEFHQVDCRKMNQMYILKVKTYCLKLTTHLM